MYICENCNHRFETPEYNYSTDYVTEDGKQGIRIHSSDNDGFSMMEYAHSGTGWISCPECGSEMIIDEEDLE